MIAIVVDQKAKKERYEKDSKDGDVIRKIQRLIQNLIQFIR